MAHAGALASLRSVLGEGPTDQQLSTLLSKAGFSVAAAVNIFYEEPEAPADKAPAPSKKRPAMWGPANEATKQPKLSGPPSASVTLSASMPSHPEPAATSPARVAKGPLAERMRPMGLKDLVGQHEALDQVLAGALETDRLPSLVLWGPPG